MVIDFKKPLNISICNKGKLDYFIPYKENFKFKLNSGDQINFISNDSEEGIYYSYQSSNNLLVSVANNIATKTTTGIYNSTSGTFDAHSSFNCILKDMNENESSAFDYVYDVVGILPYLPADAAIGMEAGNRFEVMFKTDIAKADLPSGNIATVDVLGGTRISYSKSAFEDDGSLISILNIKTNNSSVTISIEWEDDKISTYTFNFTNVKFGKENEVVNNVKTLNITLPLNITLTNNSNHNIGFVPYRQNFTEYISVGDGKVITVDNVSEALYYLVQSNANLLITY